MASSTFWASTWAFTRHNVLIKWRRRRDTLLEIATPLIFMMLMVLGRLTLSPVSIPAVNDDPTTHASLSTSQAADLDAILASNTSLRIVVQARDPQIALPLRDELRKRFRTRPESIVVADDIHSQGPLLAAILVDNVPERIQVTIRMSGDRIGSADVVMDSVDLDADRCMMYVDSGFASLQAAVSASLAAVLGGSGTYMLPDVVRTRTYPTPARTLDPFVELLDGIGGLYLVSAFLGFTTKFLFVLVQEKENGHREYLKVMGVSTTSIWTSWILIYMTLSIVTSIICSFILVWGGLFTAPASLPVIALILSFCAALMSFALVTSVFFNQAKSAAQFSGLALLVVYSPRFFISNLDSWIPLLLSPPIAFDHGFRALVRGESPWGVLALLWLYAALLAVLALYLDRVLPSDYGVPLPWYFPFRNPPRNPCAVQDDFSLQPLMRRRSSGPEDAGPGPEQSQIRIRHVCKSFRGPWTPQQLCGGRQLDAVVLALDDVSIDLGRSQITTILGHNGAGKSTLISILCGIISADSGTANLDESVDLISSMDQVRRDLRIGICLQTDLLFPDLTLAEHVEFCARLRAVSVDSCRPLIADLDLEPYWTQVASTLSPGVKRRLSVALAFIGSPTVVFLDEPSSGLDPIARGALWRALQSWKSGRFVVLTTHSMDGADLLSDTVVVMNGGRVTTCGTPAALKRTYAPGYILTVAVRSGAEPVREVVLAHVPEATIRVSTDHQITFLLPDRNLSQLAPMLTIMSQLDGIQSFGVTVRSLEEVFLNILNDGLHDESGPESVPIISLPYCQRSNWRQIFALGSAFFINWARDWRALTYQLVMPALYITIGLMSGGIRNTGNTSPSTVSFSDKAIFRSPVIPVTSGFLNSTLDRFGLRGALVRGPLQSALLGLELPTSLAFDTDLLYHNCSSIHALPAGLSLLANAAISKEVEFRSEPLPSTSLTSTSTSELLMPIVIAAGFSYVPVGFGISILRQKCTGSRSLLTSAGLHPVVFWTARIGVDLILYMVPGLLAVLAAVFAGVIALGRIVPLLIGFACNGAVVLAFNGLVTTWVDSIPIYSAWASILYLFGTVIMVGMATGSTDLIAGGIASLVLALVPNFVLVVALIVLMDPNSDVNWLPGIYIAAIISAIVWMLLILRTERRRTASWSREAAGSENNVSHRVPISDEGSIDDEDVIEEAASVTTQYHDQSRYQTCLDQIGVDLGQHHIVDGVSFGVESGRIFGLLGPNGAGKSTLVRCLVGELGPSRGRGRVLSLDLGQDIDQIQQILGYVPQQDAFLTYLTARQHLTLFARIKGVPESEVQHVCNGLIRFLDLGACADRMASTYSGGNKRKLSLGLSLLGANRFLVLDEPTNGLDAQARHLAWRLISESSPDRSTILITHSMREAEHLCHRMAIMYRGRLQCIGSAQHLKGRYAQSYQVGLDTHPDVDVDTVIGTLRQKLQRTVQVMNHVGYRIRVQIMDLSTTDLGPLFAVLLDMQNENLIQDYSVTQASLDDVLLGFIDRSH